VTDGVVKLLDDPLANPVLAKKKKKED